MPSFANRADRHAAWVIFLVTLACYAYFFQGLGWNQMAHFATMHSLVEFGTAEISRFSSLTQDVTVVGDRIYSNKPPGIALLGTPFYFCIISIERILGLDVNSIWLNNLHIMTVILSALPGALVNVVLFFAFRREQATLRMALVLAGAFAFGSLSWPYAGLLMSHLLCALVILSAWYLLTESNLTIKKATVAGALIGLGILSDVLTAPVALIFALYLVARKMPARYWLAYCAGPGASVLLTLLYDRLAHGGAAISGPFHPTTTFSAPGLVFGEFGPPDWRRLYWISYQPMRGLFACCPIFVLCLFAPLFLRRPFHFPLDRIAILLTLLVYLFFYLTFIGWNGGWSIGPRYLIPALPLFWIFALRPLQKIPKFISALIITVSIVYMLAATSVCVLSPVSGEGPPDKSDPVRSDLIVFVQGHTNHTQFGYNLAALLRIPQPFQLLPIFALLIFYFVYTFTRPRQPSISPEIL